MVETFPLAHAHGGRGLRGLWGGFPPMLASRSVWMSSVNAHMFLNHGYPSQILQQREQVFFFTINHAQVFHVVLPCKVDFLSYFNS